MRFYRKRRRRICAADIIEMVIEFVVEVVFEIIFNGI